MSLDRREFMHEAAVAAVVTFLWSVGCGPGGKQKIVGPVCSPLRTEQDRILYALSETILPGRATDPSGRLGAADCCAVDLMMDDRYPAKQFLGLISGMFNHEANAQYGKNFYLLKPADRHALTIDLAGRPPVITWLYKFIRSAYYTDNTTWIGLTDMGYRLPDLRTGWRNDPGFSLRRPVGAEMTDTGFLP